MGLGGGRGGGGVGGGGRAGGGGRIDLGLDVNQAGMWNTAETTRGGSAASITLETAMAKSNEYPPPSPALGWLLQDPLATTA